MSLVPSWKFPVGYCVELAAEPKVKYEPVFKLVFALKGREVDDKFNALLAVILHALAFVNQISLVVVKPAHVIDFVESRDKFPLVSKRKGEAAVITTCLEVNVDNKEKPFIIISDIRCGIILKSCYWLPNYSIPKLCIKTIILSDAILMIESNAISLYDPFCIRGA